MWNKETKHCFKDKLRGHFHENAGLKKTQHSRGVFSFCYFCYLLFCRHVSYICDVIVFIEDILHESGSHNKNPKTFSGRLKSLCFHGVRTTASCEHDSEQNHYTVGKTHFCVNALSHKYCSGENTHPARTHPIHSNVQPGYLLNMWQKEQWV